MNRRDLLTAALPTAAVGVIASRVTFAAPADELTSGGPTAESRQYYEWRTYRAVSSEKRAVISDYLKAAALPAWGRIGLGPVGVFTEIGDGATPAVHVLLTYSGLAKFDTAREALEADPEYQKAGAAYLASAKNDAAFERIESSLMVAFAGMPQLQVPQNKPQAFELRTYESHSEERARKKIDMFNAGEMPIFTACGFQNIFFGETLIGPDLPNLKYMVAAPDMAANKAAWEKFRAHPDWLAMKDLPEYKDTVTKATPLFLEPTPYSQI